MRRVVSGSVAFRAFLMLRPFALASASTPSAEAAGSTNSKGTKQARPRAWNRICTASLRLRSDERPVPTDPLSEPEASAQKVLNNPIRSNFTQYCGVDLDQDDGRAIGNQA